MADFPFFKDSLKDFPGLDGLDGQSYRDTYDYSRYRTPATLRLLSVPWRSDYKDVVRFANEAARDAWFAGAAIVPVEYSTPWLRIPAQSVNVPLPYERAARFNYLYLDVPVLPVDGSEEPTRLFYFITGVTYAAPSTTTLTLELDIWQTYGYRMEVASLMLERGHAPMYRTSVDEFLEDPISSTRYLLAKDVDYSNGSEVISHVEHYPVGEGAKWLCVALPILPGDLGDIGAGTPTSSTPPSYGDDAARNGYQLDVSGYQWSYGGYSYPSSELPASSGLSSDGRTLDGMELYAVAFPGASEALAALANAAPHVLAAASFVAVLPDLLVSYDAAESVTVAGYTWRHISATPSVEVQPFELTRANIRLPEYASEIAKLYTYPYTRLKVQDQEGNGFEVRIEDIAGNALEFNVDVSLAAATLACNIEAVNVGTGAQTVIETWRTLDGSTASTLYGSDLAAHMIEWGIPTYQVVIDAGSLEAARRWASLEAERQAALNSYRQAVRNANTTRANAVDGNATATANTARSNATAVTNTQNSGTVATANTTLQTQNETSNANLLTATRDGIVSWQNAITNNIKEANNDLNGNKSKTANDIQALLLQQSIQEKALATACSLGASLTGAVTSAMAGDVGGAIGAAANAVSTSLTTSLAITNDSNMSQVIQDQNEYLKNRSNDAATEIASQQNQLNTNVKSYQNDLTDDVTTNNNALAANVNTNNVNLANANAQSSANTSNANAQATQGTSDANAGYSRNDAVTAAKENLEQAQRAAQAALRSAGMALANAGAVGGDNTMDAFARRSFAVKAVTQSDYALKAAADYFKRYGYALDAPVEPASWLEGGAWCYWKGCNAIIKGSAPDLYRRALESILEQGVTVWETPESVGRYV